MPGRFGGTEGERAVLHAVKERLTSAKPGDADPPPGALEAAGVPGEGSPRIEGFVARAAPHISLGVHAAALLIAGVLGFAWPLAALPVSVLASVSLFGEGTGRFSLVRWGLPRAASYNLVVARKVPKPLGAVVIAAPLDVPRWRPVDRRWTRFRPLRLVLLASVALGFVQFLRAFAEPWGPYTGTLYGLALAILAATVVVGVLAHRAGDGADDGGGPAVLLDVLRCLERRPVPDVDVWVAFVGCGRDARGGMDAFLALHGETLGEPCLVVALDDAGRPPLRAVTSEGALLKQRHLPTGPALVERLRWAGLDLPSVDRAVATDARTAMVRGFRAIGFAGGVAAASPQAVARSADVIETLVRWYGHDLHRVAGDRDALESIARAPVPASRRAGRGPTELPADPAP